MSDWSNPFIESDDDLEPCADRVSCQVYAKWLRKLNLITKHINELDAMVRAELGEDAEVFFEPESGIHVMMPEAKHLLDIHHAAVRSTSRVNHIVVSSNGTPRMGAGAW